MSQAISSSWQSFSDQISMETQLRLQLDVLPHDFDPASGQMQLNASLLETLLALDKPRRPLLVDDERNDYSGELQLISARLDLVMAMLGRVSPAVEVSRHPLRINACGALLDPALTGSGSTESPRRLLRLYFEHCPTVALDLSGTLDPGHPGFVGFDALSPAVHDGLERLVFMHHRRQIAASRGK